MNMQFTIQKKNKSNPILRSTIIKQSPQNTSSSEIIINNAYLRGGMLSRLENAKPCNCGK